MSQQFWQAGDCRLDDLVLSCLSLQGEPPLQFRVRQTESEHSVCFNLLPLLVIENCLPMSLTLSLPNCDTELSLLPGGTKKLYQDLGRAGWRVGVAEAGLRALHFDCALWGPMGGSSKMWLLLWLRLHTHCLCVSVCVFVDM